MKRFFILWDEGAARRKALLALVRGDQPKIAPGPMVTDLKVTLIPRSLAALR